MDLNNGLKKTPKSTYYESGNVLSVSPILTYLVLTETQARGTIRIPDG